RIIWMVSLAIALRLAVLIVRGFFRNDTAVLGRMWSPQPLRLNARSLYMRNVCGTIGFTIIRNDFDLEHREWISPDAIKPGFVEEFKTHNPRGFSAHYESPPNVF